MNNNSNNSKFWIIFLSITLVVVFICWIVTGQSLLNVKEQLKDQQRLELQIISKDAKIKELEKQETEETTKEIDPTTLEELLEFVTDYKNAQESYIETLQEIMQENGVQYPLFIYANLGEKE